MTIPLDKQFTETDLMVRVTYYPIFADGSRGHIQSAYLPWTGNAEMLPGAVVGAARTFFATKYGPGKDEVVSAEIIDRTTPLTNGG